MGSPIFGNPISTVADYMKVPLSEEAYAAMVEDEEESWFCYQGRISGKTHRMST